MLIMTVVGARPQFIKAGPVSRAILGQGHVELLVHTGQHYDEMMSDSIMRDVGLREPDVNLGVGSASHGVQTARMLEGIESTIVEHDPDVVVTYGDTNSTIAGALAASKLGIPTAHIEAGLRSFNRAMPEEMNRIATDHLSDILLAPTQTAVDHLAREGLAERTHLSGDVMVDALRSIDLESVALPDWASGEFMVATVHRAENTDDAHRLRAILEALNRLSTTVHLLAHPRMVERVDRFGIDIRDGSLEMREPVPYSRMLGLLRSSKGLLTDSGGLQKEAFILGVPCVTLREETEWPETFAGGRNVLAGDLTELQAVVDREIEHDSSVAPFGQGDAAEQIITTIVDIVSGASDDHGYPRPGS